MPPSALDEETEAVSEGWRLLTCAASARSLTVIVYDVNELLWPAKTRFNCSFVVSLPSARLQQKVWSQSGELKAGEAGRSLNSHRQPEHFKNTSFFFFLFSIYPFMKRWEGSGAVRAQQGSRRKSYLNLEMLFGFTVEVSYQLQFLFDCLLHSVAASESRKTESCWLTELDLQSVSLKVTNTILQKDPLMIHDVSSESLSAPSSSSFSLKYDFFRSSRGRQWWNSLTRTDDDNSVQSKSIKQKLVWFLLRTLRSVFSPDWWTQIAVMDWFHVENGCKNQSVGSVFSSLCLRLPFFRKSESFKFRDAPELHASSRSSLASSLA